MTRYFSHALFLILALCLSACTQQPDSPGTSEGAKEEAPKPFIVDEQPEVETEKTATMEPDTPVTSDLAAPIRTTLEGKWVMALTGHQSQQQPFVDIGVALFEIQRSADKSLTITLLENTATFPDLKVTASEVDESSVRLTLGNGQLSLDFQGTLDKNGVVRGNIALAGQSCNIARLDAMQGDTLKGNPPFLPAPGRQELLAALQADDRMEAIQAFIDKNPDAPLTLMAYQELLGSLRNKDMDDAAIREIVDGYIDVSKKWGDRMVPVATANSGLTLASVVVRPDLALEYLDAAEKGLAPLGLDRLSDIVKQAKKRMQLAQAQKALESDDPKKQEEAATLLQASRKTEPFNYPVTFALASYAEKQEKTDEAIALYAELAALPMAEGDLMRSWRSTNESHDLPSETLARLWKEKNGNTDGLEQYLNKVYDDRILSFVDKSAKPELPAGNRTVLCEMLTGAQCPPCVGVDVAMAGLEAIFPLSRVVVLRYHQHIPGPDPMANEDTEARLFYYNAQGTPTVLLNGKQAGVSGGMMQHVQMLYDQLLGEVTNQLAQTTEATLSVTAKAEQGKLVVNAEAGGLKEVSDDLRLRVVLAEDAIDFIARNGIRRHEMVVRRMLAGNDGVEPKDGKLAYSESIELGTLKKDLTDYLKKFESGSGIMFSTIPLEMTELHVVAFIQNEKTHEVLQTASTAVTGEIVYPEIPETTEETPDAKKPEEPKTEAAPKPETNADAEKKPAETKPTAEDKPAVEQKAEEKKPESGPALPTPKAPDAKAP